MMWVISEIKTNSEGVTGYSRNRNYLKGAEGYSRNIKILKGW
jgi:hypothetical protein